MKCPVANIEEMMKTERGSYYYQSVEKKKKTVIRWNGNSIVTLGRSAIGFPAMKNVKC